MGIQLLDYAVGGGMNKSTHLEPLYDCHLATSNNTCVQGYTGPNGNIPVPSVLDQLEVYISSYTIDPADIYIIMIGGNDAFLGGSIDGVEPAIASVVSKLVAEGLSRLPYMIILDYNNNIIQEENDFFLHPTVTWETHRYREHIQNRPSSY
jgi:hypothetical protein